MLDTHTRELLQRGVSALERMAEDPVINLEIGIPACPHCETVNPIVMVRESEAAGRLAEAVFQCTCQSCHQTFIAMPVQWFCARDTDEAAAYRQEHEMQGATGRAGNGN
jgi:hypothetical protein